MNEPTRPNFQFHRAHPVAGPGVEPDDWVIPTDKPAGTELLPPQRSVPRQPPIMPEPEKEVMQEPVPSIERITNPVTERAAGLTTRRPTQLDLVMGIFDRMNQLDPHSCRQVAALLNNLFR